MYLVLTKNIFKQFTLLRFEGEFDTLCSVIVSVQQREKINLLKNTPNAFVKYQ